MPPPRLLLQAAEVTKAAAEAASAVGQHAADDAFTSLLWLGLILATVIAVWQFFDNRKVRKEKDAAIAAKYQAETQTEKQVALAVRAALQEARADWQKEMAVDIGHEQRMTEQAKTLYENEITRLREDNKEKSQQILENNKELRQQESKSAQVLEATANSLRTTNKTTLANNANTVEILRILAIMAPQANPRPGVTPEIL